jgi:CO dehydrogenase/acetyl-CoA synthase beta subunit
MNEEEEEEEEEEERKRRRQEKEVQRVAANYQVDYIIRMTKSTQTFMNILSNHSLTCLRIF